MDFLMGLALILTVPLAMSPLFILEALAGER